MIDSFRTVGAPATGRITRKKSRFLSFVVPVSSPSEIHEERARIRRLTHDASHHCIAFRLLVDGHTEARSDDDGEPPGSAGVPILQQLEKADLLNTLAVVVRYFGGTKLGIGGLVRAYAGAVAQALTSAPIITRAIEVEIALTFPTEVNTGSMATIHRCAAKVLGIEYDRLVHVHVALPPSRVAGFREALREATGDRASLEVKR